MNKQGHTVFDLPYLQLKNDDRLSDDAVIEKMVDLIKNENIDICFMFLLPNVEKYIVSLKQKVSDTNCSKVPKIIFYNFDDPKSINIDLMKYSKGIDYLLTPNAFSAPRLRTILHKNIKVVHHPIYFKQDTTDEQPNDIYNKVHLTERSFDICVLYDTLYNDVYDMKNIIKEIKMLCVDKNFSIKLLGNQILEQEYPDIYEGTYDLTDVVAKTSDTKIIVYMHGGVLSEAVDNSVLYTLMLGGSIVMTPFSNQTGHVLKHECNCLIFDRSTYLQSIQTCIKNQKRYEIIRSNAIKDIKTKLSIDSWSDGLIKKINE